MNLYGCELLLKEEISAAIELYKTFHISIQDLEKTEYQNTTSDFVTSLSVIEHGINIQNYFKEMNRIIKKDGLLLTSTDYWPDNMVNLVNTLRSTLCYLLLVCFTRLTVLVLIPFCL
jgi:2-polyprenyl-3-methyl-5-hydroxy-6-metoxy-1,4-benzoquinol methylase